MKLRVPLLICLLMASMQVVFAHAIWIETAPMAKKGSSHSVKIFFGEYGDNERDSVANWFSDLKDIQLWLVSPNGQKTPLSTSDAVNHLSASFLPKENGVYTLLISHIVKDIPGKSKIEYYASATVIAGTINAVNTAAMNTNEVSLFSESGGRAKAGQAFTIQSFYKNKPAEKQKITIVAPGGWEKNVYSKLGEKVNVTPSLSGVHMVEVMHNPKEPGEHNGKPFESTWKIATYCINVEK